MEMSWKETKSLITKLREDDYSALLKMDIVSAVMNNIRYKTDEEFEACCDYLNSAFVENNEVNFMNLAIGINDTCEDRHIDLATIEYGKDKSLDEEISYYDE